MTEFKVGDRVRVVADGDIKPFLSHGQKIGAECVVKEIGRDGDIYPWGLNAVFDPSHLELVKPIEERLAETPDLVNHPSHYNEAGIECIEAIRATLGSEFPAYCKGNVMKYLWRYQYKNGIEDLKKAQVYLNWMVEYLEGEDDNDGNIGIPWTDVDL